LELSDLIDRPELRAATHPAFIFLNRVRLVLDKIRTSEVLSRIFSTGYSNVTQKNDIETIKHNQVENFILLRKEKRLGLSAEKDYHFRLITREEHNAITMANEALTEEIKAAKTDPVKRKQARENRNRFTSLKFTKIKYLQMQDPDCKEYFKTTKYKKSFELKRDLDGVELEFLKEAHIGGVKKTLREDEVCLRSKSKVPLEADAVKVANFMLSLAATNPEPHIPAPDYLFNSDTCPDSPEIESLKRDIHKETNVPLAKLLSTQSSVMSYRMHLFAQQLIHFGSYKNRRGTFYVANTGIKNICCLIAGTRSKPSTDPGVPFLFFWVY